MIKSEVYTHFLVDTMLQQRQLHAPVTLFVDYESDVIEATKYVLSRSGADVTNAPNVTDAQRAEIKRHADDLKDIIIVSVARAGVAILEQKKRHPRVAVYARVSMTDKHTAPFLTVAGLHADHLVVVTV